MFAVSDDSSKDKQESKRCTPQNDLLAAITAIKSEVEALKGDVRKESSDQSVPHGKGLERRRPPTACVQAVSRTRRNSAITVLSVVATLILQGDAGSS